MSSPDATNAVKEYLLRDDESSNRTPQPVADDHEIHGNDQPGTVKPQQLQRYWTRTLALILIPCIITVWYGIIWVRLVLGVQNDEPVGYRTFSGSLIYYSWFIIGVFGLSWSKYGLAGVEVSMLRSPFWRAPNLIAFLMHANTTWSSPSGWLKAIYHREFHRLWCLLALLTVLPFIAFPLSGLVFELSDGYIGISAHPLVVGRNMTTFNKIWPVSSGTPAEVAWEIGSTPTIPGLGVVYTREGLDRTKHSSLGRVPNALPLTDPIPDMFLAPQGDVPLSGKAWGLRVKYDCSIVRNASEFTILSEKPASAIKSVVNATGIPIENSVVSLRTPSGHSIDIFSTDKTPPNGINIWAYIEMGTNDRPGNSTSKRYSESQPDFAPDDVSKSLVFEYALWQIEFAHFYDEPGETLPFNRTLDPVIEGMGSPFLMSEDKLTVNDTFFKIRGGDNFTSSRPNSGGNTVNERVTNLRDVFDTNTITDYDLPPLEVAAPIGVRCVVSSGLGTAALDAVTTTFSDFKRVDPDIDVESGEGYPIFGHTTFTSLYEKFFELFYASHLPTRVPHGSMFRHLGYVHPQALQQAVMLAYGMDALQLMYNINPGPESAWLNTDLTSSREGKILVSASLIPGTGTGYLVLALFCLWSGLSAALGIVYGFRKRPSDKIDGYGTLRRGVNMSEDLKHNGEFTSGQSFYDNKTFRALPGS